MAYTAAVPAATPARSGDVDGTPLTTLSDDELIQRLQALAGRTRAAEADLLRHLGEVVRDLLGMAERDMARMIDAAVTEKLQRLEARRFALTATPRRTLGGTDTRAANRHVPAAVRRAVFRRDGGQCRFVDRQGRRCPARSGLELHHRHPYACGGDHAVDTGTS